MMKQHLALVSIILLYVVVVVVLIVDITGSFAFQSSIRRQRYHQHQHPLRRWQTTVSVNRIRNKNDNIIKKRSLPVLLTASQNIVDRNDKSPSLPYQRRLQGRKNTAPTRKPRNYWKNITNIENELREQWKSALLPSSDINHLLPDDQPPPIPSFTLLMYWQRHDLVGVMRKEGRSDLAEWMGGAMILPGKWKDAAKIPIVKRVIELDDFLREDRPPPSPQQLKQLLKDKNNAASSEKDVIKEWNESERWNLDGRRRRGLGYWSKKRVMKELCVS